ncbi:hypothetical protein RRG08_041450 [Elysia crispata]|uniref:Uncharacterized protein n=1 Tax=Elysia crispata TaxID=231223 RepID=A0AAE1E136_9GAST|nr:hypothetical protein RRG08_041450 [Elysia crispata]
MKEPQALNQSRQSSAGAVWCCAVRCGVVRYSPAGTRLSGKLSEMGCPTNEGTSRPLNQSSQPSAGAVRSLKPSTSLASLVLVLCGAVRCGAVWCGAVRCGVVRCCAVRCGAVRYIGLQNTELSGKPRRRDGSS